MQHGVSRRRCMQDGLGSVRQLVGADGKVWNSYAFTAWGVPLNWHEHIHNRYTFTSCEYDTETLLYHYRLREYATLRGRFVKRDPVFSWPDYTYAFNSPLNMVYPGGTQPIAVEALKRTLEALIHRIEDLLATMRKRRLNIHELRKLVVLEGWRRKISALLSPERRGEIVCSKVEAIEMRMKRELENVDKVYKGYVNRPELLVWPWIVWEETEEERPIKIPMGGGWYVLVPIPRTVVVNRAIWLSGMPGVAWVSEEARGIRVRVRGERDKDVLTAAQLQGACNPANPKLGFDIRAYDLEGKEVWRRYPDALPAIYIFKFREVSQLTVETAVDNKARKFPGDVDFRCISKIVLKYQSVTKQGYSIVPNAATITVYVRRKVKP
ncbi:MAG: hypothetical protein DRP82_01415 [Planctomycetota bacterium]|nr:MAG: hypothetical protein DRP82_01415 [Planctomycetota bacterium]